MFTIMLLIDNEREMQILRMAFEQMKVKAVVSRPTFSNYVKATQYRPDVVLVEMPKMHAEQLQFIKLLKKHKKTKNSALLTYGNPLDKAVKMGIVEAGADCYLDRPLKFSALMKIINLRMKQLSKSVEGLTEQKKSDKEADIAEILNQATQPAKKLELMERHVAKLMAFPFAVSKVLSLADSAKTGASDLSNVIETDPVITTNILKVSNSVFFASAGRRISSIRDAIVRIGFRETKRIVMGMSVMKMFDQEQGCAGFSRVDFWEHCVASGVIAEKMAKRMGDVNPEEAFLAGLLHDFGIILLDEFFPSIFSKVLEATTDAGCHFVTKEKEIVGVTHTELTGRLFESWKIPQDIVEAITTYEAAHRGELTLESAGKKLALCTAVANTLAKVLCLGAGCDQVIRQLGNWAFQKTKLPTGPNQGFVEEVSREMDGYRTFFGLDKRKLAGAAKDPEEKVEELHVGVVNPANAVLVPPEPYLQAQGHRVARVPLSETYTNLDQRFDCMLIWAGGDTQPDILAPFHKVLQRPRGDGENGGAAAQPPLPVLTFVQPDAVMALSPGALDDVSAMHQTFDLRQLEANMELVCSGQHLPLPPAPEEGPEASSTAPERPSQAAQAAAPDAQVTPFAADEAHRDA